MTKNGEITEDGGDVVKHYVDGKVHRVGAPAVLYRSGLQLWMQNDQLHREDGPAVERADGTKEWWHHGQRHRESGPAVERADGTKEWWQDGKIHREDGPAIEKADGSNEWRLNGQEWSKAESLHLAEKKRQAALNLQAKAALSLPAFKFRLK